MFSTLIGAYGIHLFHWFWQSAVVAELALAIVRWLPRSSASFRAAVLSLAFWKFMLPPMLPSPTGLFSRLPLVGSLAYPPSVLLGGAIAVIAVIHAIGGATRWARLVRERRALRRRIAQGRRHGRLRVVVVGDRFATPAPAVFGGLRPALMLPARFRALASNQRRMVFAHERSHLERGDGWVTGVEEALRVLAWIHPSYARVIAERRHVREERCDAAALARTGASVDDYTECLLAAAEERARATAAANFSGIDGVAAFRRRITALGQRAAWSRAELGAAILLWAALLPGIRPWA